MTQTTVETTNYTTCMKNYYIHVYRDIIFARAVDHTDLIIFFLNCQDHNMNTNAKNNPLNYEKKVEIFN